MKEGKWYMFVDSDGVFSLIRVNGFGAGLDGVEGEIVHYTAFVRHTGFEAKDSHAHIDNFTKYTPEAVQIDAQVAEDLLTTLQRKTK